MPRLALPLVIAVTLVLSSTACRAPWMKNDLTKAPSRSATVPPAPQFQQGELSPAQAAQACIVTAEELEKAGHGREAIALYERARRHDPDQIDYSRRLAVLYDQAGDAPRARSEYDKALAQHPDNADLCNDAGYFHLQQGELTEAEKMLRQALARDANHQRAWTNLGIVLAQQGRYQDSFEAFAKVSGAAAAHANVGAIMARQGRLEEAEQAFRKALQLNPRLPQPRAFLARFAQEDQANGAKSE